MKLVIILTTFIYTFFPSISYTEQEWTTFEKNIVDVITVIEIENDNIWLGTANGLAVYDKNSEISISYTVNDGLIDNTINDIAVDHDGVKWIATNNGISSFDGKHWTSYMKKEKILSAAVDHDNTKWFVTNESLLRYDGKEWEFYTIENGLPVESLTTIEVDKTNTKWIGTNKKGILSFNGNEWTLHDLYKPNVVSIAVDNDNTIWFGDFQGKVYSFNGIDWSVTQIISKFWFLYSVDVDSDGFIWVGTNNGLYQIKNGEKVIYTEENGLEKSLCRIVSAGENGEIWIAGFRGLTKFDGSQFKNHLGFTGLSEESVVSIAIDHDNIKWFGHKSDSISYYNDASWSEIKITGYNCVGESIAVDNDNVKWFTAHGDGVLSYDGREITNLVFEGSNSYIFTLSVFVDGNNLKWFCNYSTWIPEKWGHICSYDGETIINHFLNFNNVKNSFAEDSKNRLWILSGSDLQYYDGVSLFPIPRMENNELPTNEIYLDKNDVLWGTSWDGLYRFDGDTWSHFTTLNSELASDYTISIATDPNNVKWIGTDAGVSRFDGETWMTFNTKNSGLCNDKVNAIAVEKNNTIWFGTDNGVSRYTGEVITTSVDEEEKIPEAGPLIKSYPNPFNPATTIEFSIPQDGLVKLNIYNIAGQKVKELIAEYMTTGTHSAVWDGKDESGEAVSAGIYITRLKAGNHVATGKMVLVK